VGGREKKEEGELSNFREGREEGGWREEKGGRRRLIASGQHPRFYLPGRRLPQEGSERRKKGWKRSEGREGREDGGREEKGGKRGRMEGREWRET
jgi:hypothetical protein